MLNTHPLSPHDGLDIQLFELLLPSHCRYMRTCYDFIETYEEDIATTMIGEEKVNKALLKTAGIPCSHANRMGHQGLAPIDARFETKNL